VEGNGIKRVLFEHSFFVLPNPLGREAGDSWLNTMNNGCGMDKKTYRDYLSHPLWIKKRDEILKFYGKKCTRCNSTDDLAIHHKTYANNKMPWEYPLENFEVLCEKCHKERHNLKYLSNKCKGCGKKISEKYDYCFDCYKKLNNKIEKRLDNIEKQINENIISAPKQNYTGLVDEKNEREGFTFVNDKNIRSNNVRRNSYLFTFLIPTIAFLAISLIFILPRLKVKESYNSEKRVTESDLVVSVNEKPTNIPIENGSADYLAIAENRDDFVPILELNNHIGKTISTSGVISEVIEAKNGNVYINLNGKFPHNKLSLVIFPKDKSNVSYKKYSENSRLFVNGKLLKYKNINQIVIKQDEQISTAE